MDPARSKTIVRMFHFSLVSLSVLTVTKARKLLAFFCYRSSVMIFKPKKKIIEEVH
jgi:hypothetical protein